MTTQFYNLDQTIFTASSAQSTDQLSAEQLQMIQELTPHIST